MIHSFSHLQHLSSCFLPRPLTSTLLGAKGPSGTRLLLGRYSSALWMSAGQSWLMLLFSYNISGNDRAPPIILTVNKDAFLVAMLFPRCVIIFQDRMKTPILCLFFSLPSHLPILPLIPSDACWTENCWLQGLQLLFVPEIQKSLVVFVCVRAWEQVRGVTVVSVVDLCGDELYPLNMRASLCLSTWEEMKWQQTQVGFPLILWLFTPMNTHSSTKQPFWKVHLPVFTASLWCVFATAFNLLHPLTFYRIRQLANDVVSLWGHTPSHVSDTPLKIAYL